MLPRFCKLLLGILLGLGLGWPVEAVLAQTTDPPPSLWVDLPAVVVELDVQGNPTVGGLPLTNYAPLLGPELAALRLQPAFVRLLSEANIQHIQIANTPSGLLIRVNGELVPSLGWSEQSLQGLLGTLTMMGAQVEFLDERLLPMLESARMSVVIYLPRNPAIAAIPIEIAPAASTARRAETALADFLATVGEPPHLRAHLYYRPDGDFELAGLTGTQFTRMGIRLQALLTLAPGTVRRIGELGIQTVAISTQPEGIFFAINGQPLPHLIWSEGAMQHLLALAAQAEILEQIGLVHEGDQLLSAVDALLPMVQATRLELTIHFPALAE